MKSRLLGILALVLSISGQSYSEPEAIAWERVLDKGPWADGEPIAIAHDNNLWLVGGMSGRSVWKSANGKDWACIQPSVPWYPRDNHCAFAFGDSLWVHGGGWLFLVGDLWRSDEKGMEWKRVFQSSMCFNEQVLEEDGTSTNAAVGAATPEVPWTPRCRHSVALHNGMVWMAGGLVTRKGLKLEDHDFEVPIPADAVNDVWCSADGEKWNQVTESADWTPRSGFGFFSLGGKLWVIGGAEGNREDYSDSDELWSSEDGRKWTLVGKLPCGPRSSFGLCDSGHGIYLLGGSSGYGVSCSDVWFTPDGTTWKCVGELPEGVARTRPAVAWFGDRLWLIGGSSGKKAPTFFTDVWVAK